MLAAQGDAAAGQGDVDGCVGEAESLLRPLEVLSTTGERVLQAVPDLVQPPAGLRPLCRGQGGHLIKELRHDAPPTQVGPAHLLQGVEGYGVEDRPLGLLRDLVEIFEFGHTRPHMMLSSRGP